MTQDEIDKARDCLGYVPSMVSEQLAEYLEQALNELEAAQHNQQEARLEEAEQCCRDICKYCKEEAEGVANRKLWLWSDQYVHGIDPRGMSDNPLLYDEYYGGYAYCLAHPIRQRLAGGQGENS